MSGLGLDQTEELQLLQQEDPAQPPAGAGFFSGAFGAGALGLASGAVKATAPLAAGTLTSDFNPMLGAMGGEMFPTEASAPNPTAETLTDEQFDQQRRAALASTFADFRPDPTTTGFAGQLLFGLTDVGSRFVAGTALAGPVGGAALAGVTEGYAVTQEQIAAGVDSDTAQQVGVIQGGAVGVGGLLPVGFGVSTAMKVGTGVALNVGVGAASRGTSAAVLEASGYTKQAEQFKWLDATAILTDAVLGAGFGYVASPHAAAVGQRLFGDSKPAPEQIAAAAVANQQHHVEIDTAPGIVVDAAARDAHVTNVSRATEALLADEPMPAMRDVSVVENPAAAAFRAEVESAIDELAFDGLTVYHGSNEPIAAIDNRGIFGGLFASGRESAAKSHGDILHEIDIPNEKLLTQRALSREIDDETIDGFLQKELGPLTEDELAAVRAAVIDDEGTHNLDIDEARTLEIFRSDDLGEASWEAQRYRGRLARELGYQAVEMADEHGTSYLVLPGARIRRQGEPRGERRADAAARARIDDMEPAQRAAEIRWLREENDRLNNELRTDPLTGLGNRRAWAEIENDAALPVKAMLDVDSLKWVNDNLGHEAGDAYLVQVGEAMRRAGAEKAARLGGDEFAFAARTPEAADALAARINEELAQVRVEATTPDGRVITKTGAGVSYGRGANKGEADAGLYRNKSERTAQGLRSERGTEPAGVARSAAPGKQGAVPGAGRSEGVARAPDDGTSTVNAAARSAEDLGATVADESAAVALAEQPGLKIVDDAGNEVLAADALAEADAVVAQAQQDASLFQVAAACFTRAGE